MRFLLTATIAMTLAAGPATAAAAATIDAAKPEALVTMGVKALRANDAKLFVDALPVASRKELEAQWTSFKSDLKDPKRKDDRAELDKSLARFQSPTAVDDLMKELEPQLKAFDPQKASQGLMMMGGFAGMMLSQGKADAPADPARAKLGMLLQGLSMDIAQWIPVAKLGDPATCRKALTQVVAGVRSLGIKDTKALEALSFNDAIARLGPALASLKAAGLCYDLHADTVLDSVKATTTGSGDARDLMVGFEAFGRPRELQLKMARINGAWQIDPGPVMALVAPQQMTISAEVGSDAPATVRVEQTPPRK